MKLELRPQNSFAALMKLEMRPQNSFIVLTKLEMQPKTCNNKVFKKTVGEIANRVEFQILITDDGILAGEVMGKRK